LLASLAAPFVGGIDALQRNFEEARGRVETWLTVSATQRLLVEDLPQPIVEFERRFPLVRLRLRELGIEQVTAAVAAGEVDLGLVPERCRNPSNPWLVFEPAYSLDFLLVTPKDHPLSRRRRIRPRDLLPYPLVNAPGSLPNPATNVLLEEMGAFTAQPRRVEAIYTAVIRRYVELGFGIGIVAGRPVYKPSPRLHERPLGREFGRVTVYLAWRKGAAPQGPARAFVDTIKSFLS
jgi:DNA-binding transcriptional LysR family regulator